ncbi:MAG: AMP-binding protein, partial [Planctomycetes bacterium]|nr:AMP-binding protein [Planctomycetota bacterium]
GYLHQPELTQEKFVPDPFSAVPGARMYRTGDLVRWQENGELEFLGRLDHQVKLRGFRIELGEIETALRQQPHINQAVVALREDRPGDKRLVAYLLATPGETPPDAKALRDSLKARLPEYMLPAAYVVLDQFPLTANGKIDRQKLPAPTTTVHNRPQTGPAPVPEIGQTLTRVFREVLGVSNVGPGDSFFDLGGNSLLAVQAQARIQAELRVRIPLRTLFESPSVAELAGRIGIEIPHAGSSRGSTAPQPTAAVPGTCLVRPAGQATADSAQDQAADTTATTSRRLYRFLALSDHWVARGVRAAYHGLRRLSLPAPGILIKPLRYTLIGLRTLYYFLLRTCICEPVLKSYFRKYGRNFHSGVYLPWIQGTGDIIVGDNVTIDGKIQITFAARYTESPALVIGDRSGIGHNCMFTVGRRITIGNRCRIATDVWMFDSGGHPLDAQDRAANTPLESQAVRPIEIGDDVWIGRRCLIFPGVTIGQGSVIVPASVVMSNVPPYSLVSGHPAKVVGQLSPEEAAHDPERFSAAGD